MDKVEVLPNIVILIATAVFVVAFFKRLRLSPVLGYLVSGTVIGDHGLKFVSYHDTHVLAEFGVVFLLFAIGLELSFERLKAMRKYVFGFGSLQVIMTTIIIGGAVILFSKSPNAAIIIGGGLALSSTAVVLQVIAESRSQATQVGRISLAVLLLQDFAVVPLLILIPILGSGDLSSIGSELGIAFMRAILAMIVIFIFGRVFLRPIFSLISTSNNVKNNEIFIAATILIALSAAWGTEAMGLSLALGAFVAGILVAETEFQLQAEDSIAPFKGLLLGLFFMNVGMTIDIWEIWDSLSTIIVLSVALLLAKALIISGLCIVFGFTRGVAIHTGLLLSQGGEFAFILFNLAMMHGILDNDMGRILLLVVTFTMALTPLLSILGKKAADYLDKGIEKSPVEIIELGAKDLNNHVIISGFGRVGRMVARILEAENMNYIVLDVNPSTVKEERANGFPVFRGDISSADTLKAAGVERAAAIVIAMDNEVTVRKALKRISYDYPEVAIVVRSKNLQNSGKLYEAGATVIVPEDYETGLQLGGAVLKSIGISEFEISRMKNQFRAGNYVIPQNDDEILDEE